jgi:hypothetical protein
MNRKYAELGLTPNNQDQKIKNTKNRYWDIYIDKENKMKR